MSTSVETAPAEKEKAVATPSSSVQYAGFAAGIASGWTKLIVGHPFDTIKTRVQCAPPTAYKGALDCFIQTVTREGPRKLYAGALAPALGWSVTDSILMGSLHNYRRWLKDAGLTERDPKKQTGVLGVGDDGKRLSLVGHSIAGMFAGFSNAAFAHPIETIKSKLQLQMGLDSLKPGSTSTAESVSSSSSSSAAAASSKSSATTINQTRSYSTTNALHQVPKQLFRERYTGPIDVVQQTVKVQGLKGMWKGFGATLWFRSSFAWMFGGFEFFNRQFAKLENTPYALSQGTSNFIAGGMASNAYWAAALPADNVKNRIMSDGLSQPKYKGIWNVVQTILHEKDCASRSKMGNLLVGGTNFYRGVVPVALRAFPTNAAALTVWEAVMRSFSK